MDESRESPHWTRRPRSVPTERSDIREQADEHNQRHEDAALECDDGEDERREPDREVRVTRGR